MLHGVIRAVSTVFDYHYTRCQLDVGWQRSKEERRRTIMMIIVVAMAENKSLIL